MFASSRAVPGPAPRSVAPATSNVSVEPGPSLDADRADDDDAASYRSLAISIDDDVDTGGARAPDAYAPSAGASLLSARTVTATIAMAPPKALQPIGAKAAPLTVPKLAAAMPAAAQARATAPAKRPVAKQPAAPKRAAPKPPAVQPAPPKPPVAQPVTLTPATPKPDPPTPAVAQPAALVPPAPKPPAAKTAAAQAVSPKPAAVAPRVTRAATATKRTTRAAARIADAKPVAAKPTPIKAAAAKTVAAKPNSTPGTPKAAPAAVKAPAKASDVPPQRKPAAAKGAHSSPFKAGAAGKKTTKPAVPRHERVGASKPAPPAARAGTKRGRAEIEMDEEIDEDSGESDESEEDLSDDSTAVRHIAVDAYGEPIPRSRYVGVRWYNSRWTAEIRYDGEILRLGYFHDELGAARAYDAVVREHDLVEERGLNFPRPGEPQAVKREQRTRPKPPAPLRVPLKSKLRSKYVGVIKLGRAWCARIAFSDKVFHLGCYSAEIDAARAYDDAVRVHGLKRPVNFPKSPNEQLARKMRPRRVRPTVKSRDADSDEEEADDHKKDPNYVS